MAGVGELNEGANITQRSLIIGLVVVVQVPRPCVPARCIYVFVCESAKASRGRDKVAGRFNFRMAFRPEVEPVERPDTAGH
jgi:hypothetical protein